MSIHTNHSLLRLLIIGTFSMLSIGVAVMPAYNLQEKSISPDGNSKLTRLQTAGLHTYIAEGCVACHTQQVRNIAMDKTWGDRPSIASDYAAAKKRMGFWQQSPSILGSERTGPDLTNIGKRQSSITWHLLHLYNPRIVVKSSIMPAYPWLFVEKMKAGRDDVEIRVPEEFLRRKGAKVVATEDALELVEYLLSLKQPATSGDIDQPVESTDNKPANDLQPSSVAQLDGAQLYKNNCSACHQPNGEGIPGAFPSLKGSSIVNDSNLDVLLNAIMYGYDAREEFATMPPFGEKLTDEEIQAIVNHERSSWGNNASSVSLDQVKAIRNASN